MDTTVAAKPTETRWDPFLNKTVPSFGVPDNLTTTTWWSSGPRPGGTGMAVVLGHYYSAGYGVFNHLGTLHAGDQITIDEGKTVLRYRVSSIDDYLPKTDANALSDALRSNAATAQLALISCTGAANQTYHEIEANVVVFARLLPHTTN